MASSLHWLRGTRSKCSKNNYLNPHTNYKDQQTNPATREHCMFPEPGAGRREPGGVWAPWARPAGEHPAQVPPSAATCLSSFLFWSQKPQQSQRLRILTAVGLRARSFCGPRLGRRLLRPERGMARPPTTCRMPAAGHSVTAGVEVSEHPPPGAWLPSRLALGHVLGLGVHREKPLPQTPGVRAPPIEHYHIQTPG